MSDKGRYALFTWPGGTVGWWYFRDEATARREIEQPTSVHLAGLLKDGAKFTGELLTEQQMFGRGLFHKDEGTNDE